MEPLVSFQLITNEMSIKNNHLQEGSFSISPRVTRSISEIDAAHFAVQLIFELVNTPDVPFPVDIRIDLTGMFDTGNLPKDGIDEFLKYQAVQIMFPYIRSMVSSMTSGAMMVPVVLPIIDVREMFREQSEE